MPLDAATLASTLFIGRCDQRHRAGFRSRSTTGPTLLLHLVCEPRDASLIPASVRATDVSSTLLFIFHRLIDMRLKSSGLHIIQVAEELCEPAVEPFMKTKHIFGLVAVVAATGFAASAQAGWSLNVSFAAPVWYAPPVVVAAPRCLPPVIACPPAVVYRPAPAPCRPVVYAAPRCAPAYGYRDYRAPFGGHGGGGHKDRGHHGGGRR